MNGGKAEATIRIVFTADTHLGFDYPLRPRIERRRRGSDFFANFRRVLSYAAATKPDMVVHGGDLFFRSRVPPAIVDIVYDDLLRFAQTQIPFFIVPGNHERARLPGSLWLSAPNIHVFDSPRTFCLTLSGHRVGIAGFPFQADIRDRFHASLEQTDWRSLEADVKLLCMHQTVEGAVVGPSDYVFRSGPDVAKMADIPTDFACVLAGHIHRRQILYDRSRDRKTTVVYAGAIERTSFAERDEPKGFFEVTLGRNPSGAWTARLDCHDLPTRPMVDIELGPEIETSQLRPYLMERIATIDEHAIVRLKGVEDANTYASLTSSFTRSVFPDTMTVELSGRFLRPLSKAGAAR